MVSVRAMQLWINSRTTGVYGSQMEHWLQLMCCALAVVLVLYFGDVRGRLRKHKRDDEELLKSILKLKTTAEYSRSLYSMVEHRISYWNGGNK